MRTLLTAAINARDLISWSNDYSREVDRLIELGRYEDATELANNYIEQERTRRRAKKITDSATLIDEGSRI